MKIILLFLATIAVATGTEFEPGLRVKFSIGLNPGVDFYYKVPQNTSEAITEGWTAQVAPTSLTVSVVIYCPPELNVCGYYDADTGYIVGLHIAIAQGDVIKNAFDWATQGFVEWAPTNSSGVVVKHWCIKLFLVPQEYFQKTLADRKTYYNVSKTIQDDDNIWVNGFNGQLDPIPTKETEIAKNFTKQACIPGMGRHYYYNMSSTTECKANSIYPWFPIVDSYNLIAMGFMGFMNCTADKFFEKPTKTIVKIIVPKGSTCFYDYCDVWGVLTCHVYFINKPWHVGCYSYL